MSQMHSFALAHLMQYVDLYILFNFSLTLPRS